MPQTPRNSLHSAGSGSEQVPSPQSGSQSQVGYQNRSDLIIISRPLFKTCHPLKYTLLHSAGLVIRRALSFRAVTIPNLTNSPPSAHLRHTDCPTHLLSVDLVIQHYRKVTQDAITIHVAMRRLRQEGASMGKDWIRVKLYAPPSSAR